MWVILNDSFFSAVEHYNDKNLLVVRARKKEHLEKVFLDAEVFQDLPSDYPYRIIISKQHLKDVMAAEVERIDYHNFKSSISKEDDDLYKFANEMWASAIRNFQGFDKWIKHAPKSYFKKQK